MEEIILIYIGDGAYWPGVPARDLTAWDVETSGQSAEELLKSGLYATPETSSDKSNKRRR
jgi:hypothetical protein